jgi:hypothetical protein
MLHKIETARGVDPFNRNANGSLYDRGSADYYYWRQPDPHWFPHGTYKGLPEYDLTDKEEAEYMLGYNDCDDRKDYG